MKDLWLVIAGMTLVTFLPRVAPLLLLPGRKIPKLAERWLSLVAPAILAALLTPELLLDRTAAPMLLNPRVLAAIPTFLVAWKTKSLFAAVVAGMAASALLTY
ncbi:MAG: AzlD domain-containing protein [Synergistaceae bacterium]|jgi:branched-subunit amino acid transport protein|nr:AzlD domain-containing protein [Synergistaceae bacterium]